MLPVVASYFIWTVGCQMNKADSERLAGQLEGAGLSSAASVDAADVVVVNSCSVRDSAEQRVVGKLGFLKGLRQRRPDLLIALTGCMVPPDGGDLPRRLPFVDFFLPPLQWDRLLVAARERAALSATQTSPTTGHCALNGDLPFFPIASDEPVRFVPIVYGCDNFCTYCIVPYRRGRERSRPIDEVVAEVESLVYQGAAQVTLLGQNVDSYGHDLPGQPGLAELLTRVNEVPGLRRIRFLTSHPKDMSERLIESVAALPKVCEHINLPVQAGDDRVLSAMRRGYTIAQYRQLIGRIRAGIPGVALSTDLIVGFPGETRAEFERSHELLADLRFDVVHAAMYSPRAGTVAGRLPDDVPAEEKRYRLDQVEQLQETIARESHERLVGTEVEVLVERCAKGKWEGRTRTDKLVFFPAPDDWRGRIARVIVSSASAWSVQGELQGEAIS
ncbi:MAG: tRNA (N6-isopentenyl adenosine(37)-C2)-methylthiotransferase MiaB [Chloroflexota bacterium]